MQASILDKADRSAEGEKVFSGNRTCSSISIPVIQCKLMRKQSLLNFSTETALQNNSLVNKQYLWRNKLKRLIIFDRRPSC
jgi:hypothetical protein